MLMRILHLNAKCSHNVTVDVARMCYLYSEAFA